VRVTRGPKNALVTSDATVHIGSGTYPGAGDCLGAGQSWSATGTGVDYQMADELPEAVVKVTPEYPASARSRGLVGGLIVNVIVCRSGRVLDASASWGEGVAPIPELEELAITAARQWVFKPALLRGEAIATTVAIPLRFPPP
jgi:protein TonB